MISIFFKGAWQNKFDYTYSYMIIYNIKYRIRNNYKYSHIEINFIHDYTWKFLLG